MQEPKRKFQKTRGRLKTIIAVFIVLIFLLFEWPIVWRKSMASMNGPLFPMPLFRFHLSPHQRADLRTIVARRGAAMTVSICFTAQLPVRGPAESPLYRQRRSAAEGIVARRSGRRPPARYESCPQSSARRLAERLSQALAFPCAIRSAP